MQKKITSFILMLCIFAATISGTHFVSADSISFDIIQDSEVSDISSDNSMALFAAHYQFSDVSTSDWFYDYVSYVYEYNLFNGTTTTAFSPNVTMTRGMMAVVIYRFYINKGITIVPGTPYFTDVSSSAYYYDAVTWCYSNGVITGTGNAKYSPDNPITRQETATMLGRLINTAGVEITTRNYVDSSSIASWATNYVNVMSHYEIITGYTDGTFKPLNNVTRAECAKMIALLDLYFKLV